MNKLAKSTMLILAFTVLSVNLVSQNYGSLEGVIINNESGKGIPGVNVLIEGTLLGTATGLHGGFNISNIPPGKYNVVVSCLGFSTLNEQVVIVKDQTKTVKFTIIPSSMSLESVQIEANRSFSSSSAKSIRQFDMKTRPARSSQDLLMLAPGLIIAQHAGGGKAEQIFMRGFDADHGTDVAISVDGLPVNMVTHGHGQGYADLHFLIPEIVESIDVYKGPYFSQFGDFATAGAVSFSTIDHPDLNMVKIEAGMFNTGELTTVLKIPTSNEHQSAYMAGQFYTTDGPFESPQNFNRANVFGKFHSHLTNESELAVTMSSFTSAWDASGQIPTRAVKQGIISRFGAIDDMEGGTTGRTDFSFVYNNGAGTNSQFFIQGYSTWYNFKLFSNFTYYLNDPVNGDMIEQTDNRSILGINTRYIRRGMFGKVHAQTTVGMGLRADNIVVQLWKSPDRIREKAMRDDYVYQRNLYMYMDEVLFFNSKWRMQLGLRGDYFTFDLNDHMGLDSTSTLPHASTYAQKLILNPKINLVYSPTRSVELFINIGSGFHSNDARDVIIAQRVKEIKHVLKNKGYSSVKIDSVLIANNFDPNSAGIETLPRALGAEVGSKANIGKYFILGVSGWYLYMEEELVFIGDEGTTEISGKTQRFGLDIEARAQLTPWLWADADLNLSRNRYIDEPKGENHIPLAPEITSTGGLTAHHPSGFEASVRYRYVGSRPANETNTVTALGYTLLNARLGYQFKKITFYANLENMLNTEWNEAQFDTESRLKFETHPVSEINFTPGNPFNVKLGAIVEF